MCTNFIQMMKLRICAKWSKNRWMLYVCVCVCANWIRKGAHSHALMRLKWRTNTFNPITSHSLSLRHSTSSSFLSNYVFCVVDLVSFLITSIDIEFLPILLVCSENRSISNRNYDFSQIQIINIWFCVETALLISLQWNPSTVYSSNSYINSKFHVAKYNQWRGCTKCCSVNELCQCHTRSHFDSGW